MTEDTALDFSRLDKQLQLKKLEVSALLEVTQAINNNLSVDKLFRIYQFILRAQIAVSKIVVFIKDDDFTCICQQGVEHIDLPRLLPELEDIKRITFTSDIETRELSDFHVIIPVYHKDEALAFALLGKPEEDEYETLEEKIKFIQTITNIIVVASENKKLFKEKLEQERLKRDLQLAKEVQTALIPMHLPQYPHLEMHATYEPHQNIGGDYYDVIERNEDEILFCIADVSGKGMSAALLMANFQAVLRTLAPTTADLRSLVEALNSRIIQSTAGDKFITMFLAVYNQRTRELSYVNAGHNPPLLTGNGQTTLLQATCTVIGILEELPSVKVETLTSHAGGMLLMYTDGLVELTSAEGQTYNEDMLVRFADSNQHLSIREFNDRLKEELVNFRGGTAFDDDITLLGCKFVS
jgi:sigma-B regulation protein RsbU (phosphoserine phosphatase)